MKALAEAVVESAAFLALSGDDEIHPDSAVRALEYIAYAMQKAPEEEKQALLYYCREKADALTNARSEDEKKRRDFYVSFGLNLGIADQ